jgi:8-oxo-dGTP pyrophosphatase MutT (NUDIX family)
MPLPAITAARNFDASAHLPFYIADDRVGWVRQNDVSTLKSWPDVFEITPTAIRLAATFNTLEARSAALGAVIGMLAADGRIPGWRNETYAIRNTFDAEPLAFIERAASRFFGTMTYAVHLNGIVEQRGHAPNLWIARRSDTKATDPGMLDNVVAGGIGWGMGIEETLAKECWEEAGMPPELAGNATRGRVFYVLQSLPEGTQAEQINVFDLSLPIDFAPRNQDGEVGEHRLARIDEVARWIEEGSMTVDASLATLDLLLRRQWIDDDACVGMQAVFSPPVL